QYRAALALALHDAGDQDAARREYANMLRRNPEWPAEANAMARGLAVAPIQGYRNGHLAIQLARQVCFGFDNPPPAFLDTLAAAYAEAGLFEEAIATAQKALALASGRSEELLARQ